MATFSERHGYAPADADITTRDAPDVLRSNLVDIAYEAGMRPSLLRMLACKVLMLVPNPNNWSEFPNIDDEVRHIVEDAQWFEVYDLIEAITNVLPHAGPQGLQDNLHPKGYFLFEESLNRLFRRRGIGWQLIDRQVEYRGMEAVEAALHGVDELVRDTGRATAASELHQAITDLSHRPDPDITGAIQHAMAALECAARDHVRSRETLGQLIQDHPHLFPPPLDTVVSKAWGYTSNFGRHLVEGMEPNFGDAELMVGLSAVLCRYLARKKVTSS